MPVESDLSREQYSTNGTTGPWAVGFYFLQDEDLLVVYADADGNATTLALTVDYAVTGAGDPNGGAVTTTTAYASGGTITITRNVQALQPIEFQDGDQFPASAANQGLDRLTMLIQQLLEQSSRTLRFPVSDGAAAELPGAATRANTVQAYDADGAPSVLVPASGSAADVLLRLADGTDAAKGAALVALDPALSYPVATPGWWARHVGVSIFRYIPSSKWAAIVAGTNTDDLTTYVQAGLDDVLTYGFKLTSHGYWLKCNGALTCVRSSAAHTKRIELDLRIDNSGIGTTATALTVGATSTSYFLEDGSVDLKLVLRGPETVDPRDTAATGTNIGLALRFCGQVTVDVDAFGYYKPVWVRFSFPVRGRINARRSWVGVHLDEAANLQDLEITLTNCRYGVLVRSEDTVADPFLDSGKSNTQRLKLWVEGTSVGMVVDTDGGVSGSGAIRHRGLHVHAAYLSSPASTVNPRDFFRVGTRWSSGIPAGAGADCTEFLSDFTLDLAGGLVNPSGGAFTSTQALVAFDSTSTRCRRFDLNAICTSVRLDADTLRNKPLSGWARTGGYPSVSDGIIEEIWWDNSAVVRQLRPDGTLLIGAKTTAATVAEIGNELQPDGQRYATADGQGVDDLNRLTSDGTIVTYRRGGTAVGSVSVTGSATAYNTSSDYRIKSNVSTLAGSAALAAVKSWQIRSFTWNATGQPGIGVIAHELQAVKPEAVTGAKDGPETQGVDYSKLVPELVAAVQHIANHVGL